MKQLALLSIPIVLLCANTAAAQRTEAPRTLAIRLAHASHAIPDDAPHVVMHVPAGFDPATPLALVVFLHGWRGCALVLEGSGRVACRPSEHARVGWALGAQHDRAGTNSIFVVPQLTWRERNGKPGSFAEPGFARTFFEEIVSILQRDLGPAYGRSGIGSITLVAHSAGYETALAILADGGLGRTVRHIVLMDALYAGGETFADWILRTPRGDSARLVSLYTGRATTWRENRRLFRDLSNEETGIRVVLDPTEDLAQAIRTHEVVINRSPSPHGAVPARHLTEVLRSLGLPSRADRRRPNARPAR